jgi:drug/metabolite transporter (DMT)-like permease
MSSNVPSSPTVRKNHLDFLAISLLFTCCVFWGFQQVLVKATLAEVPPVLQAALRFSCASVLIYGWCVWRKIKIFSSDFSADKTWHAGLWVGVLFALEFACLYVGMQYSSASRLTVFLYTSPFVVALVLPFWVPAEKLKPLQWLGLLCAFVAVAFALSDNFLGANHWLGDLLALAAGLFWGLTTVVIRATSLVKIPAAKLLWYQLAVSAPLLWLCSYALGEEWRVLGHLSQFALLSMTIQIVLGACVSYLAWMWMLGHYPATKVSAFVFLTPVFALLFGAMWLKEAVTLNLLASLVLVGVGIVLVNRK